MTFAIRLMTHVHALLLNTYPSEFRAEFGEEMKAVFAEAVAEAAGRGRDVLAALCLLELRDWLRAMPTEQWRNVRGLADRRAVDKKRSTNQDTNWRHLMSNSETNTNWHIENRRDALLVALPPTLVGLGIALSALVLLGAGTWRDWPQWRLGLAMAGILIPNAAVVVGGIIAALRRLPDWGYTWVGGALMGIFMVLVVLADEAADSGGYLFSAGADVAIALVIMLVVLVALGIAAFRGWERAGLVSIGLAATMGLGMYGSICAAPFYRFDLALLAAPVGLLVSLMIFIYVRQPATGDRIAVLVALALLNVALAWAEHLTVWEWVESRGGSPTMMPFVAFVTAVLLAGPVIGVLSQSVRPLLRRA